MTSQADATALLPQKQQQLRTAWQQYVEARKALLKARDELTMCELVSRGEFSQDAADQWECGYYGVRKVEPVQRCHAVGSHGPWGWVTG